MPLFILTLLRSTASSYMLRLFNTLPSSLRRYWRTFPSMNFVLFEVLSPGVDFAAGGLVSLADFQTCLLKEMKSSSALYAFRGLHKINTILD